MKPTWKKYLLYGSVIVVVGVLTFILIETSKAKNTGFETKTLWDWMELLVIPLVLALGAFVLNRSERNIERQNFEAHSLLEREIAVDRQQEAALQAYLDRMAELLLEKKLRVSENEELRNVAKIRTLTVLRGLDTNRKAMVIRFLSESGLITGKAIINLSGVDLFVADLTGADLTRADLSRANLFVADLSRADLSRANLGAAKLSRANLIGANLIGAHLFDAKVSAEQLAEAASLEDAVMPDGKWQH